MGIIFDKLNEKLLIVELENLFQDSNIKVSDIILVEDKQLKFRVNGDKILVEKQDNKIIWFVNKLYIGEIFGNNLLDIVAEYQNYYNRDRGLNFKRFYENDG